MKASILALFLSYLTYFVNATQESDSTTTPTVEFIRKHPYGVVAKSRAHEEHCFEVCGKYNWVNCTKPIGPLVRHGVRVQYDEEFQLKASVLEEDYLTKWNSEKDCFCQEPNKRFILKNPITEMEAQLEAVLKTKTTIVAFLDRFLTSKLESTHLKALKYDTSGVIGYKTAETKLDVLTSVLTKLKQTPLPSLDWTIALLRIADVIEQAPLAIDTLAKAIPELALMEGEDEQHPQIQAKQDLFFSLSQADTGVLDQCKTQLHQLQSLQARIAQFELLQQKNLITVKHHVECRIEGSQSQLDAPLLSLPSSSSSKGSSLRNQEYKLTNRSTVERLFKIDYHFVKHPDNSTHTVEDPSKQKNTTTTTTNVSANTTGLQSGQSVDTKIVAATNDTNKNSTNAAMGRSTNTQSAAVFAGTALVLAALLA